MSNDSPAARERGALMDFQAEAVKLTRARLRADKGLIGFVGGPWTLYVYAAAGSHEKARRRQWPA